MSGYDNQMNFYDSGYNQDYSQQNDQQYSYTAYGNSGYEQSYAQHGYSPSMMVPQYSYNQLQPQSHSTADNTSFEDEPPLLEGSHFYKFSKNKTYLCCMCNHDVWY